MKQTLKRTLGLALTAALALSLFTGCSTPGSKAPDNPNNQSGTSSAGTSTPGGTASGPKTLRISMTVNPPSLDPQMSNSMAVTTVLYHTTDGLMRNNCGQVDPAGATGYDVSDDGLTYTFHLRKGNVWSDGQPVTADDYVYGIQRLMDPATAAPGSYMGAMLKNANEVLSGALPVEELGISAPDENTVVVELAYPAPYFPSMLSSAALLPTRRDLVEKYGQDFAATPDKNVYNGPYVVSEFHQDSRLVLTKNDKYWDKDNVKLDQIEIYIVTDTNTGLSMYETGQLDVYPDVPSTMASEYKDKSNLYNNGSMDYLQINLECDNPYLKNQAFRQALSYGLNREELLLMTKGGLPQTTGRLVLPVMPGNDGKTFEESYPYDPYPAAGDAAKAQELLAQAMQELNVTDASQISFKINYSDSSEATRKIVEVVQEQWKQTLGIAVELNPVPYALLYEYQGTGDFEMMYTGWTPDYDDPVAFLELFQSDGAYNHSHHYNDAYDAEMKAAQTCTDPKERNDHLAAAEKIVCEDLPMLVLDADRKMALWDESKVINFQTYHIGTLWNAIYTDMA